MRIAVIGAGSVGGLYGGLLARSGEEVVFLARGRHLQALRERGLVVKSPLGEVSLRIEATGTVSGLGSVDLVLFCVKTYDTEGALGFLPELCGSDTVVLSLQNGVDSAERISRFVDRKLVIGGLTYVESRMDQPGVIAQMSKFHRIVIGELDGSMTERLTKIRSTFRKAAINCEISSNIRQALWTKFLFLCAIAEVTSVTRSSIGEVLKFPATRDLVTRAMEEIVGVANSQGVILGPEAIKAAIQTAEGFDYSSRTSMQRDVENNRPLEVDSLTGKVVELGRLREVSTPLHHFIYTSLRIQHLRNLQKL